MAKSRSRGANQPNENTGADKEEGAPELKEEGEAAPTANSEETKVTTAPDNEAGDTNAPESGSNENPDSEKVESTDEDPTVQDKDSEEDQTPPEPDTDAPEQSNAGANAAGTKEEKSNITPDVPNGKKQIGYDGIADVMSGEGTIGEKLSKLAREGDAPVSNMARTLIGYIEKMSKGNPGINALIGGRANQNLFNIIRATLSIQDNKIMKARMGMIITTFVEVPEVFNEINMMRYEKQKATTRELKSFRNTISLLVQLADLSTRAERVKNIDTKTFFSADNTVLTPVEAANLKKYFEL